MTQPPFGGWPRRRNLPTARTAHGATRQAAREYYLDAAAHYVYASGIALHVAAAGDQHEMAQELIARGAEVRARNRPGAEPLRSAADGTPGTPASNPDAQTATVAILIAAGADPNAAGNSGVMPLHRAVRTRCAAASRPKTTAARRRCSLQRAIPAAAARARPTQRRSKSRSRDR